MVEQLILSMAQVSDPQDPFSALYYVVDTENGGMGDVENVPGFVWDRAHSNACVMDKVRGFSFYYARRIFDEGKFTLEGYDIRHSTADAHHYYVIGRPYKQVSNDLLMVIETEPVNPAHRGKVRIVTAMVLKDAERIREFKDKERKWYNQRMRNIAYMAEQMSRV